MHHKEAFMYFKENLLAQLFSLKRQEEIIHKELSTLPKGTLIRKHSHNKIYFYEFIDGKRRSLFSDDKKIQEYEKKTSLEFELHKIQKNICTLNQAISNYHPLSYPDDGFWDKLIPDQNNFHPEHKTHLYHNTYYRSKSEVMIASMLTSHGIEFKYEPELQLDGKTIYPDFVIKRPKDGKIIIWEHSGMFFTEQGPYKFTKKLELYQNNNFYLWDTLIYTFDNQHNSLNVDYIEKIIQTYIL